MKFSAYNLTGRRVLDERDLGAFNYFRQRGMFDDDFEEERPHRVCVGDPTDSRPFWQTHPFLQKLCRHFYAAGINNAQLNAPETMGMTIRTKIAAATGWASIQRVTGSS